jgi:uncharacterized membrane protein YkvI
MMNLQSQVESRRFSGVDGMRAKDEDKDEDEEDGPWRGNVHNYSALNWTIATNTCIPLHHRPAGLPDAKSSAHMGGCLSGFLLDSGL